MFTFFGYYYSERGGVENTQLSLHDHALADTLFSSRGITSPIEGFDEVAIATSSPTYPAEDLPANILCSGPERSSKEDTVGEEVEVGKEGTKQE